MKIIGVVMAILTVAGSAQTLNGQAGWQMDRGDAQPKTAPEPFLVPKASGAPYWGCPAPYFPFQSWTRLWKCVKGEFEAKSTWNLYKEHPFEHSVLPASTTLPSSPITQLSSEFDPENTWLVTIDFNGKLVCDKWKRKDGLLHSLIAGQEYTQTCKDGKLGLLTPVSVEKP